MNPAEAIAVSVGLITILGAILTGITWIIKAQINMAREFKPNGGDSTRDQLDHIRHDLRDIRLKIDNHIDYHIKENR